jgi:diaminopimelate epimerase
MTRALRITRGRATGNDFVLVGDPAGEINLSAEECARLAHPREGDGSVGVIRAVRSNSLPEGRALTADDPDAEWFMDRRHGDGSPAELCGNALRVFVAFLMADGLVDLKHGDRIAVATRDGVKDVQVGANGGFRVDLGRWKFHGTTANAHTATLVVNGVSDALDGVTVESADPLVDDGIGRLSVHTNDTVARARHSWATAAATAALAARHQLGTGAPNNWRVDVPDGSLGVQMFPTEEGEHVLLSGSVELAPAEMIEI